MKQNLFSEKGVKFASILFGFGVLIFMSMAVIESMKISSPQWVETTMAIVSGVLVCTASLWHFVFGIISYQIGVKDMPSYSDERKTKRIETWLYCYVFFLVFAIIIAISFSPSMRSLDSMDKQIAQAVGFGVQIMLGGFCLLFVRWIIRKITDEVRLRHERKYAK